jgi:hypothetical protein
LIAPKTQPEPTPPMVGGYVVDYSPLSAQDIASPAKCDELLKTGNWVPVNRKS